MALNVKTILIALLALQIVGVFNILVCANADSVVENSGAALLRFREKRAAKKDPKDPNGFQALLNGNPDLKNFLKGLVAGGDKHLDTAFSKIANGLPSAKGNDGDKSSPAPSTTLSTTPTTPSSTTTKGGDNSSPKPGGSGNDDLKKKLRPIIGNIMNEVVKAIGELEGGDEGQSSQ